MMRGVLSLGQTVLLALGLLYVCVFSTAQATEVVDDTFVSHPFRHDHWHIVVSENVDRQGRVQFSQIRVTPKRLTQYLKQLAQVSPLSNPDDFPDRRSRLAYWINAHNALVLRLILDQYPVPSLKEVPDLKTSTRYRLGGRPTSVAEVEALVQEQFYPWPASVLALSELSVDSPRLLNEAYRPEALDAQLEAQFQWVWQQPHLVSVAGGCAPIQVSGALKLYEPAWKRYLTEKRHLDKPGLMDWIRPVLSPDVVGAWASACSDRESALAGPQFEVPPAEGDETGLQYQPRDLRLNVHP